MAATLEDLEKRLTAVEQELAMWRLANVETPAERGARLLREASLNQDRIAAAWATAMEEAGIRGEPISAEELQKMFAECGVNPEDNEFSRGIIEMREE
ncbi:MAG: hypothetical protein MOB07_08760 [Acidobacteria bacterium]|nr:hypothetical protein [Acidobacteriota bacterium]